MIGPSQATQALDPRPDLPDTASWGPVLAEAAALDWADPNGVTGLLRFARCLGATLDGRRLVDPPGEGALVRTLATDYGILRATIGVLERAHAGRAVGDV